MADRLRLPLALVLLHSNHFGQIARQSLRRSIAARIAGVGLLATHLV